MEIWTWGGLTVRECGVQSFFTDPQVEFGRMTVRIALSPVTMSIWMSPPSELVRQSNALLSAPNGIDGFT